MDLPPKYKAAYDKVGAILGDAWQAGEQAVWNSVEAGIDWFLGEEHNGDGEGET